MCQLIFIIDGAKRRRREVWLWCVGETRVDLIKIGQEIEEVKNKSNLSNLM